MTKFISTTIYDFLNESTIVKQYDDLINIAKQYDYDTFLNKTDNLNYQFLYRGMSEGDILSDNSFMTDYIGHAREYGEYVDGVVVNNKSIMYFDNDAFDYLRKDFIQVILPSFPKYFDNYVEYQEEIKEKLRQIYKPYFNENKLTDAMYELDYTKDKIIDFVYDFLVNSTEKYEKYSKLKINDFFIPFLTIKLKEKGKI
jgi:hypothetical protein